jgi:hypothetical protein
MTTLRKWRFPILIGSGLIAAGGLVYFSNRHLSNEKTQGAIGQREVYRDGQVNSADVATPGSAPVANEAILESSEFKSLAKNPAFQELLKSDAFNEAGHRKAIADLMVRSEFQAAAQDARFAILVRSEAFQLALRSHADLALALRNDAQFRALDSSGLRMLLRNDLFTRLAREASFQGLLASSALRQSLRAPEFALLASHAEFQKALESGSMARAMADLRAQLRDESSKK